MFEHVKQKMKEHNVTWKDVIATFIIGLAMIWITNHVLEHVCLC